MGLFDLFKKKNETNGVIEEFGRKSNEKDIFNDNNLNETINMDDVKSSILEVGTHGFEMIVEDTFSITGRGTIVTGKISIGEIHARDTIRIKRLNSDKIIEATITGIEMFRKILSEAHAGDNVGLLIRSITKNDISKGDLIFKD